MNFSNEALKKIFEFKESQGSKIAFVDKSSSRKTNWKDFINYTNSIVQFFKKNQLKIGDVVAIDLPRTMEHFACRLACLAFGAIFLSISEQCPENRKTIIFNDCKPALVIDETTLKKINFVESESIIDDTLNDEDLGYIVYTTGTTGKPKGVLHDRSIFENFNSLYRDINGFGWDGSFASLADTMFVMSIIDMVALEKGVPFHIVDDETKANPLKLREYFIANDINYVTIHPALLYYMGPVDCLKLAFVGGESCSYNFDNFDTYVLNSYGMSECPLIAFGEASSKSYLNKCFEGSKICLDGDELCYSGPGVMRSYTNEVPLSEEERSLFHTGDIASFEEGHGYIIKGRKNCEFNINGKRINTTEIEFYISQIDGVAECAVVNINSKLVAFYSTKNLEPLSDDKFDKLKKDLLSHCFPSKFIFVQQFKRNQNGKVDKKTLSNWKFPLDRNIYQAPKTKEEKVICKAFEKVLDVKKVSVDETFSQLSGDSMQAVEIVSMLNKMNISVNDVLNNGTPESLAKISISNKPPKFPKQKLYPLNNLALFKYENYYHIDPVLRKNYPYYTISVALSFKNIKAKKLINSINEVLDAHLILKAKLDGPNFVRRDDWYPHIEIKELNFKPDSKFLSSEVKPIDYSNDNMFRAKIYTYKKYIYLLIDVNHIVCDGFSMPILMRDFAYSLIGKKPKKEEVTAYDWILKYKQDLKSDKNNSLYRQVDKGLVSSLIPKSGHGHTKLPLGGESFVDIPKSFVEKTFNENTFSKSVLFLAILIFGITNTENIGELKFLHLYNGRRYSYLNNTVGCLYEFCPIVYKSTKGESIVDIATKLNDICNESKKFIYPYEINKFYSGNLNIIYNYVEDYSTFSDHSNKLLNGAKKLFGFEALQLSVEQSANIKLIINADRSEDGNYKLITYLDKSLYGDGSGLKYNKFLQSYFSEF